jgi:hypothetical protein
MVSLLFAPGYLDDDVPMWGRNPLGVDALDGLLTLLQAAGLILVLGSVLASVTGVVARLVRYRGGTPLIGGMGWALLGTAGRVTGERG